MEYILAPWRWEYIKNAHNMPNCIFCDSLKLNSDEDAFILFRGNYNFIIMNKYPYNTGHLMIAPYRHLSSLEDCSEEEGKEMLELLKSSISNIKKLFQPQGFNIGMNLGKSAGAGVLEHYHLHVVPRWEGDSNFMAIFGNTKVLVSDVSTVYEKLAPLFKNK
ncbi:MAG: HIT domain-containing protein [Acidobacteriota bacterium]